jgi:hypothetical protein
MMSDVSTEPKGGVEDPNLAAFGIGGEDAPATSADDVTMAPAGRSPAGTPPPEPTQAEIDAELAQLRGEGGGGGQSPQGDAPVATPPSPGTPEALESDLNAWFDANKPGGSAGGVGGEPVPPSGEQPAPSAVPGTQQVAPQQVSTGTPTGQVPPAVTSPQQVSPIEQRFMETYGRLPTMGELDAMIQVQNDLQSMTPQQRAAMEQALYGQAQQGYGPPPLPTQPQVDAFGEPIEGAFDPNIIDQRVQQYLAPVQQQLQQTQAMLQQQAQESAAQAQARIVSEIEAGKQAIQQQYHLTDEDTERFVSAVADTGIFNGFYSKHGNGTAAMQAAMEHALWADPGFRYVQQQRAAQTARVQEANDSQRRQRAGALAGGGGTVSRDEPVPTTPTDRKAAMVTELQQALDQG